MEFYFPYEMRPSRVNERREFYSGEFDLEQAKKWLKKKQDWLAIAFDIGTETTRYRPRFKKYLNKLVYIREFQDSKELKDKIIRYSPEDLYYSFKELKDGESVQNYDLVFHLDPREFDCRTCKRKKKDLGEDSIVFCEKCAERAANETLRLYNLLKKHFDQIQIIFTGIGYYLQVQDPEAIKISKANRKILSEKVEKEFKISKEITSGERDTIRLPGSLNGLVSRKVIKIKFEDLKDPERIYKDLSMVNFLE